VPGWVEFVVYWCLAFFFCFGILCRFWDFEFRVVDCFLFWVGFFVVLVV